MICEECGFAYDEVAAAALPSRIGGLGPRFATAFARVPEPRKRPAPDVWSPLEYACHVRDVFQVQRERLDLALRTDRPVFTPMGREERVVRDAYNEQGPPAVLTALAAAATALGSAFAGLSGEQLARTGIYNWPEPAERTLLWLGRHSVHEGEHHLLDLNR